jgi:uncharacterized membrane protein
MAGIGFELRRVLREGGIRRFLAVGLAGTAIVAGPWLLSILGILLIQGFASSLLSEAPALFMSVIVYCYSFSLIIASGLHYVFTRWISDLIWEEKQGEAGSALLACMLIVCAGSALIGLAGVLPLRLAGVISHPRLFTVSAVVLFVGINLNWLLMSFVSLLKRYFAILLVYLGGSLVSFLGVFVLGRAYDTGGALLGYAAGQWLTVMALYAMTLGRFRPMGRGRPSGGGGKPQASAGSPRKNAAGLPFGKFAGYLWRFRLLFLSGMLYAWAMWADKVVFWFAFGRRVPGAWFSIYDPFDIPVFFAMLTLIPSLIYFTVQGETSFYPRLRDFLVSLREGTYQRIQEKKYQMIRVMNTGLYELALLQGISTIVAVLLAPAISSGLFGGGVSVPILRLTLIAVFFHAVFLCLMILLFYFQLFPQALLSVSAFFIVNLAASLALARFRLESLVGGSYMAGGIAGCAVAISLLGPFAARIDRIIFMRSAKGS